MSWLHRHRWVAASVDTMHRGSSGLTRETGGRQPVTLVLDRCVGCPEQRTRVLDGHWTLQALTGVHHADTGGRE